ncbi:MAG: Imm1 family immunity protein [Actinomycetota bacterium]|nr:Imm1 family immunity protein [Actinomycetota bacterium]
MVNLEIWYDQESENDLGPGDPAILVQTVAELDSFVDRVLGETKDHLVPPMIQVALAGVRRSPVLEVGLGQQKGFIGYSSRDEKGWSQGDSALSGTVSYVYAGNSSQVPATAEIPIESVRQGLVEFLETGRGPSVVADGVKR